MSRADSKNSGPNSMLPRTTWSSSVCAPVLITNISPSPRSKTSSGGTRESMHETTVANGFWW
jgi:hypothetical protein